MISPLILKTFSTLEGIEYKDSFVRPAYGHTILGIIFIPLFIVFILISNSDFRIYLFLCSILIMFTVFAICAIKAFTLKDAIFNASNNNVKIVEIKSSYNGERRFFPLSPSVGVVMGIIINSILRNFAGFDARITICVLSLSILVGLFLGIGLTYLYFEKKIHRPIKVQRYIKKPKRQKQISTVAGMVIIFIAAVILFGGVFVWQYFLVKNDIKIETTTITENGITAVVDNGSSFYKEYIKQNMPIEIIQKNNNSIKISGSVEQEIDFDKDMLLYEGLDHDGMLPTIDVEDHNKDGYNDLLIMRDTSGSMVISYAVYLYDKNINKFIFGYFLIRPDGEKEKINYSNKELFYFSEIKKDMLNSEIKVPILLPQKMEIETDGEKVVANYQVFENGGYKVLISIFVSGENGCNGAEYCTVAYFEAEKYEGILGFDNGIAWETIKINEELEGYYFNESPKVMPTFEFVYKDTLYSVQIKNKSKEEIIDIIKDLFMDNN